MQNLWNLLFPGTKKTAKTTPSRGGCGLSLGVKVNLAHGDKECQRIALILLWENLFQEDADTLRKKWALPWVCLVVHTGLLKTLNKDMMYFDELFVLDYSEASWYRNKRARPYRKIKIIQALIVLFPDCSMRAEAHHLKGDDSTFSIASFLKLEAFPLPCARKASFIKSKMLQSKHFSCFLSVAI